MTLFCSQLLTAPVELRMPMQEYLSQRIFGSGSCCLIGQLACSKSRLLYIYGVLLVCKIILRMYEVIWNKNGAWSLNSQTKYVLLLVSGVLSGLCCPVRGLSLQDRTLGWLFLNCKFFQVGCQTKVPEQSFNFRRLLLFCGFLCSTNILLPFPYRPCNHLISSTNHDSSHGERAGHDR